MIVVGTTLAAFAMRDPDYWRSWLINAEAIRDSHPDGVRYFAALELDARGLDPFIPLCDMLHDLGGDWWTFHLDDRRDEVTTGNRLRHIVAGQNLVTDYAVSEGASHLLFLAADLEPPPDALPKLLAMNHPFVGGEVSTYCLGGPKPLWMLTARSQDQMWEASNADKVRDANKAWGIGKFETRPMFLFPVQEHMPTAAFVLIAREVFRRIRWRWDLEEGWSDDPCYWHDCQDLLGITAYVRKDCVGIHHPDAIGPIESRGHDLTVWR